MQFFRDGWIGLAFEASFRRQVGWEVAVAIVPRRDLMTRADAGRYCLAALTIDIYFDIASRSFQCRVWSDVEEIGDRILANAMGAPV